MNEQLESLPQKQTNAMAIISLIAGIIGVISLLVALCPMTSCTIFVSLLTGPLGALLGFLGKKQIDESQDGQMGRGLAIGGIVTGLISGIGAIIIIVLWLAVIGLSAGTGVLFPFLEGY